MYTLQKISAVQQQYRIPVNMVSRWHQMCSDVTAQFSQRPVNSDTLKIPLINGRSPKSDLLELRTSTNMFGHMNSGDISWNQGLKHRPNFYGISTSNGHWLMVYSVYSSPEEVFSESTLGEFIPSILMLEKCCLVVSCSTHPKKSDYDS